MNFHESYLKLLWIEGSSPVFKDIHGQMARFFNSFENCCSFLWDAFILQRSRGIAWISICIPIFNRQQEWIPYSFVNGSVSKCARVYKIKSLPSKKPPSVFTVSALFSKAHRYIYHAMQLAARTPTIEPGWRCKTETKKTGFSFWLKKVSLLFRR